MEGRMRRWKGKRISIESGLSLFSSSFGIPLTAQRIDACAVLTRSLFALAVPTPTREILVSSFRVLDFGSFAPNLHPLLHPVSGRPAKTHTHTHATLDIFRDVKQKPSIDEPGSAGKRVGARAHHSALLYTVMFFHFQNEHLTAVFYKC